MIQQSLFTEETEGEQSLGHHHALGNDFVLDLRKGPKGQAFLYRYGSVIRVVDLSDTVAVVPHVIWDYHSTLGGTKLDHKSHIFSNNLGLGCGCDQE